MQPPEPSRSLRRTCAALRLMCAAAVAACSSSDAPPRTARGEGPQVRQVWRVQVPETDTFYVGRPTALSMDPSDGSFYVADRFFGRVVRLDRRGLPLMAYGRKGRGPGEFVDVGLAFTWGDELMVLDEPRRHLAVFDRAGGTFRENRPLGGMLKHAVVASDGVWLGMQESVRRTGAARWSPSDGSMRHFAPLPPEYLRSQPLAGIYNAVFVDRWADTVAVGFQGSDRLVLFHDRAGAVDTLVVPAARRRGVPADVVERFERIQFPEMFRTASFLFNLKRLADGRLALVHYDQEIEGRAITSTAYLSVSSPDRRSWCVDGPLPLSRDAQPQTTFRGDTLFVMDQVLEGEAAKTRITAFEIDLSGCTWTSAPGKQS